MTATLTLNKYNNNLIEQEQKNTLENKADIDLGNLSDISESFKDEAVNWGAPDVSTRVTVTLPFDASYDCYIYAKSSVQNAGASLSIDDENVWSQQAGASYITRTCYIRCPKGAAVTGSNISEICIDACLGVKVND